MSLPMAKYKTPTTASLAITTSSTSDTSFTANSSRRNNKTASHLRSVLIEVIETRKVENAFYFLTVCVCVCVDVAYREIDNNNNDDDRRKSNATAICFVLMSPQLS